MLLTWATVAWGIIGAALQVFAHIVMWEDGNPERVPIARYVVGLGVVCMCFSAGWLLDDRQHPVTALWYIALLSGFAAGACYEARRRGWGGHTKLTYTRDDIEMMADAIAGEHDNAA